MAGDYWIRMVEGEDLVKSLTWYQDEAMTMPFDLTGFSAAFYLDLNNTPVISAFSPGSITLGGSAGTIDISITADTFDTATEFDTATYRLLLTDLSDRTFCLLKGQFTKEGQ